jgi:hypothetical protein
MATNRTRRRQQRKYHDGHVAHLRYGNEFIPGDGFGTPETAAEVEAITAELKTAWPEMRTQVMFEHIEQLPGTRPAAWWQWDAPEPRNQQLHEPEQLTRLGELQPGERSRLIAGLNAEMDCWWQHYRRPWAWWQVSSPQPRNYETPEAVQLLAIEQQHGNVLTDDERRFLAGEKTPETRRILNYRTRLQPAEYAAIGFDT